MEVKEKIVLFWFRRDLRLHDNTALYHALCSGFKVLPVFIYDTNILEPLSKADRRVAFISCTLEQICKQLATINRSISTFYGEPTEIFKQLIQEYDIQALYLNSDYEPYAIKRDADIQVLLKNSNINFLSFKDQVIFEKNEIAKYDGNPYTVYTPYSKLWKSKLQATMPRFNSEKLLHNIIAGPICSPLIFIKNHGFRSVEISCLPPQLEDLQLTNYQDTRDFPALESTSRLSVHLRFGTVSIREIVSYAVSKNQVWLNELIWREFFMQILFHYPYVVQGSFKPKYNFIPWRNNAEEFERWCTGNTGYPIVDAGMRELNATGFMHNRVRMITASFLTKHLLVNWQWGETYFAEKLLDFDLSANNGNWQWAAGTGCDAAPYFRIFNPLTQAEKFDKNNGYIKHWIPELYTDAYSRPIVDQAFARQRCLAAYKSVL